MAREIKFRAWDKKDKVMRIVYGVLFKRVSNKGNRANDIVELHCSDYEGQRAIILSHFERPLEDIELMQFTGLLDKQGKEIYEGDILAPMPNDYNPEYTGNWIMTFDRGTFLAESVDDRYETWAPYWTEQQFEIIGNIYENPELLQKG